MQDDQRLMRSRSIIIADAGMDIRPINKINHGAISFLKQRATRKVKKLYPLCGKYNLLFFSISAHCNNLNASMSEARADIDDIIRGYTHKFI